jgi:flagellar biosynthetic protein FlhB
MDLTSAAVLMFGLVILYVGGTTIAVKLGEVTRVVLSSIGRVDLNAANVHNLLKEALFTFAIVLVPVLAALMVVGVIANVAQVGFLFTTEPLQPKFSKLNPLSGIKRVMMSRHSFVEMVKGVFKVAIVAVVAYVAMNDVVADSLALADGDALAILEFMAKASVTIGLKVGLAFFVLAAGDYAFQRFEYEKSLRMTKEEVKEEAKQSEGDPLIKGRIRSIQRQIAYRRMMQDVPKADVVVTNPTHYAVAIKYEMRKMGAPKVVAKGVDLIAQRIKEIAAEHSVPIVEDKPLAQMLYRTVEIGDQIPEKLFQAVAQVLAYVYRLRDSRRNSYSVN